jgi:transcriptional regulator of acetoin/glycerol metabolism
MLTMHAAETVSFSEMALLQLLTAHDRRPNLLIVNHGATMEAVTERLRTVCAGPFRVCRLPGPFDVQTIHDGTLILADVDQLTIAQQITLLDWLSRKSRAVQIVSVTAASLRELVEEGRFLEGLYYRINTVVVLAHRNRSVVSW